MSRFDFLEMEYIEELRPDWVRRKIAALRSLLIGVREGAARGLLSAVTESMGNRFLYVRKEIEELFWQEGGVKLLLSMLPGKSPTLTVYCLQIISTIISDCLQSEGVGFYEYFDDHLEFSKSNGVQVVIGLLLSAAPEAREAAIDILYGLSSPCLNPESSAFYSEKIVAAGALVPFSVLIESGYNPQSQSAGKEAKNSASVILNLSQCLGYFSALPERCFMPLAGILGRMQRSPDVEKGIRKLTETYAEFSRCMLGFDSRSMIENGEGAKSNPHKEKSKAIKIKSILRPKSLVQVEEKNSARARGAGYLVPPDEIEWHVKSESSYEEVKNPVPAPTARACPRVPSMNPDYFEPDSDSDESIKQELPMGGVAGPRILSINPDYFEQTLPLAEVIPADPAFFGPIRDCDEAGFQDTGRHRLGGTSFCSGVFKDTTDQSLWVGKSNLIGSEPKARVAAVLEVIANSINAYYGVNVSESAIARLPIILPEWADSVRDLNLGSNPTHAVYLMSKIIADFQTFSGIPAFEGGEGFTLNIDGLGECEVIGAGVILAVAALTLDVDAAGGSGGNVGFQIIDGKIVCFKLDTGESFNINPATTVGPRQIRVAIQAENGVLDFDQFPETVKQEFLSTLALIVNTPDHVFRQFFDRVGAEILQQHEGGRLYKDIPDLLIRRRVELGLAYQEELREVEARRFNHTLVARVVGERDIIATLQSLRYQPSATAPHARLQVGEIAVDKLDYDPNGPTLGEGGFAVVREGRWGRKEVAIKIFRQATVASIRLLRKESQLLRELQHPNIVRAYGFFAREGDRCGLVMELCPDGTLYDLLRNPADGEPVDEDALSKEERIRLASEIADGVEYLHSCGVAHRDLKSTNVLMKGKTPLIADLGLAKIMTATLMTRTQVMGVGSIPWMAPEMFKPRAKYTLAADMFSYAMVMLEIFTGKVPWSGVHRVELIRLWVGGGERPEISDKIPVSCVTIMTTCWAQEAENRLTAAEAAEALRTAAV